ncbi:MAG: 3-hydroxyisobutyrate dehydrogenase [Legionellales bacterium]|nr:3-hydroxyisobutyrate dehydrogenase [Legionellales bacterium]
MQIGFIGLGHMGRPMAQQLLAHQYEVQVFDVQPQAVQALVDQGALAADSPAMLAQQVDVLFTMLQTGDQVCDVCLTEQGIFAHANQTLLYIDSSSIDIQATRQLHQQAQTRGIAMLDAPVSGGVAGAQAASLTFMVGGEAAVFERAKPILQCLGNTLVHAGAAGNGQVAKICNNLILGISMIAVSEAFTLAQQLGLDAQTFFQISTQASGECWAMSNYCPAPGVLADVPASHGYEPGFTAAMMLKDLQLSQSAAVSAQVKTQLGERACELYQAFVEAGQGQLDFSAIIQAVSTDHEHQ